MHTRLWRILRWVGLTVVLGGGSYYASRNMATRAFAQTDLKVTPFTAQLQTVSYGNGKATATTEQRWVAQRQDGSRAMQGIIPDHPSAPLRRLDLADGRVAMIADSIASKSSGFKTNKELAAWKEGLRNPPADCVYLGETLSGREQLSGQGTSVVVKTATDLRITSWRAPNLQCFPLKTTIDRKIAGGAWTRTTEQISVLLTVGDPSNHFFDTADSYAEKRPSALLADGARSLGQPLSTCAKCVSDPAGFAKMDAKYLQSQSQ